MNLAGAKSFLGNLVLSPFRQCFYVHEAADWVIKQEGLVIKKYCPEITLTCSSKGLKGNIIHFGTHALFQESTTKRNSVVVSCYHLSPEDPMRLCLAETWQKVCFIHTPCRTTQDELIQLGIDPARIVCIPIPVDRGIFYPFQEALRKELKIRLGLPTDRWIIGSFQKDGVGWDEGLEPKWIKGPDVLCDVIIRLNADFPLHVLLTGPARGYVKKRLTEAGVRYSHFKPMDYSEMVNYYNVLDLYLIASRVEGGPKALLESMACGVPVVSTKMGMARDIVEHGKNGLLSASEDIDDLVCQSGRVLSDVNLRKTLIQNSQIMAQQHDAEKLVSEMNRKLYEPLRKR